MNFDNLKLAIAFFQKLPADKQFEMGDYLTYPNGHSTSVPTQHTCGAAACGVGWSPSIGPSFELHASDTNWLEYGRRVYGLEPGNNRADSDIEDWLFSGSWTCVDNTPQGLALRMIYVLENGLAPADYYDQMANDDCSYMFADQI